eukprot:s1754_g6.t1
MWLVTEVILSQPRISGFADVMQQAEPPQKSTRRSKVAMEFLAAGVGAGLLNYNRKNFMFDKEQYRERAYFSQEMKDIKDLTDLTVSKMDVYMVINVLQLLFCVMLFTEGMPKPRTTPLWLHWILAASSGSAVLYFVLSIWLGMHASIAAHSFGVRLLTQFVRLPVPNLQQIHRAAAKAKEGATNSEHPERFILKKLTATLGNLSFENRAEDTTGLDDSFLPEVYMPSLEETAALRHIQLYRELQANWQAYDAYCRVCMALGTNQLLQSINAYCLGVLLSETSSGWAAACCMAVISSVSWLVVRLDVLVSWRMLMMALAFQTCGRTRAENQEDGCRRLFLAARLGIPLLTLCCLATQILFKWAGALALVRVLVPTIFVLHLFWMVCCLRLAAGRGDKVSLPGKFRGVLYLDVFGWLSPEGESPRAAPRRREEAEGPDPTEQPAEDEAEPSPQLPVAMYMTLAELSVRQRDGLARQLEKWQNPRVEAVLNDERWMEEVAKMRRRFEEVDEELSATLQRAREQPQQEQREFPPPRDRARDSLGVRRKSLPAGARSNTCVFSPLTKLGSKSLAPCCSTVSSRSCVDPKRCSRLRRRPPFGTEPMENPNACTATQVLFILLLVCISNLATRYQPSFLITIPVLECEEVCKGIEITNPVCLWKTPDTPATELTREEQCRQCRSQPAMPPLIWQGAMPRQPPTPELPPVDKEAMVLQIEQKKLSVRKALPASALQTDGDHRPRRRRSAQEQEESQADDAPDMRHIDTISGFYNMADGTCLWYWQYGLLIGYGFALVYAAGSLPAGLLCDRYRRSGILALSLFVWSICTSMQALAKKIWLLLVWRALIGLSQGFGYAASNSLLLDYFASNEKQRDVAWALLTMVGPQLGVGCASFSIVFAEGLGWRWIVLLTGGLGILLSGVVLATVKEPPRTEWSAPCTMAVVTEELWAAFEKSRVPQLLILAVSAKMLASFSLTSFLPIWFARGNLHGYTNDAYAFWSLGIPVSQRPLLSNISAKVPKLLVIISLLNVETTPGQTWSRIDVCAPCYVGMLGALLSLPLLALMLLTQWFRTSLLCYFAMLVLGEAWFGPTMGLLQKAVRKSVAGQATSMMLGIATLAGNLGPAIIGILDPGGVNIGIHLLWICSAAQVLAFLSFYWTYREITVDPVSVTLGLSQDPATK